MPGGALDNYRASSTPMPNGKRPYILAACYLLIAGCSLFPPRAFSPEAPVSPSRKFLFSPEFALERVGSVGTATTHIDAARFLAEVLVVLSLTGFALLATAPRP